MPFVWRPEYASMPSGHATTAASAAIAIGAIWPRARGVMWFYALTIMFSRVVVLAHHPSDVIAGAFYGRGHRNAFGAPVVCGPPFRVAQQFAGLSGAVIQAGHVRFASGRGSALAEAGAD